MIALTDRVAEKDLEVLRFEAALANAERVLKDYSSKEQQSEQMSELEGIISFLKRENEAKMEVMQNLQSKMQTI